MKGGRGGKVPDGMRYHVLDVWIDGLEDVAEAMDEETLKVVMGPVRKLAKGGKTKMLRERAKGVLGDERLKGWMGDDESGVKNVDSPQLKEQHAGSDEEWGGFGG